MPELEQLKRELEEIKAELATLKEGSRAYKMLAEQKATLEAQLTGSGALAQGEGATAVGQDGIAVGNDLTGTLIKGNENQVIQNSTVIYAPDGAKIVVGEQPVEMSAELRKTALGRYLEHIIAHNRYLQLQGIRSGGKLVNIELEQIYITLRTTQQRTVKAEQEWLADEAAHAPGEMRRQMLEQRTAIETVSVSVDRALESHRHLVVLGDPGSGKTTLLRYLALLYGRDLAQGTQIVQEKLKLNEVGYLPVLLPLRQIGMFLKENYPRDDGTQGHAILMKFLFKYLDNHQIKVPEDFFDAYLTSGQAMVLLDGMDEVADPTLRARVARLVEAFTLAYPKARYVVTSRIVGYSGAARLGGDYVTTTVQDFTLEDVKQFLTHWHRLVAVGQMGAGESAEVWAQNQTTQLLSAIEANERVRELAINPLMLTVIALVHRDRVKLPDRRAELYAEAVDVLLGKWDEARGVDEIRILDDRPFDAGDRRLLLQNIALHMHEREKKELDAAELRDLLLAAFRPMTVDEAAARRAVERFINVIEERTGLLAARGEGIFAFSHLTFQEYLAALAMAARNDFVEYTLQRMDKGWWREAILLEVGYFSMHSKERTTELIKSIAKAEREAEPFQQLVLAMECLRDVGSNRVLGNLEVEMRQLLKAEVECPIPKVFDPKQARWYERLTGEADKKKIDSEKLRTVIVERRRAAMNTLSRVGFHWYPPYGEPEWVTIPAGEFWMGGSNSIKDPGPVHKVYLPEYKIARVSVTNAQYALFVKAAKYKTPDHWQEGRPPKGKESHPVVYVTWHDAIAYCDWLSQKTGKPITLPSEAEWEKAARGDKDQRAYPWGDTFNASYCNTRELGLSDTTPVGVFIEGASSYGLLDMSGNVWEWTRSIYDFLYPYDPNDKQREDLKAPDSELRVLRGGPYFYGADFARCACRYGEHPNGLYRDELRHFGFRVSISLRSET